MNAQPEGDVLLDWKDHGSRGKTARIALNNPARLNVLNTPMVDNIIAAFEKVSKTKTLRAVVLTGAGDRAFIGGADLRELAVLDPASARKIITRLHDICLAIRECPVPVIARIQGYCFGAGMEVAAACDMRIATVDSVFGMPEVQVGIPSVIEAALLPRLIGWGKASELVLTGEHITANEAKNFGFLERVSSAHALDTHLQEWLDDILVAAPNAVRLQKRLLRQWELLPLDKAIEAGIDVFGDAYETDEPKTYMAPFLQRKKKNKNGA